MKVEGEKTRRKRFNGAAKIFNQTVNAK